MKTELAPSSKTDRSTSTVSPDSPFDQPAGQTVAADAIETANGSRMNRIAERAYAISQRRGGEQGRALDDWLQAEREIDEEG